MMISKEQILEWYNKGWHDELNGTSSIHSNFMYLNYAYSIGAADALVGDDIPDLDLQTEEEILTKIDDGFKTSGF